jgi:hypothetical protein
MPHLVKVTQEVLVGIAQPTETVDQEEQVFHPLLLEL